MVWGEQGNTGTREHQIGEGTGEQTQKITRPFLFVHKRGVIEDFLLFSDFFGMFFVPIFRVYTSLALALKSFFSDKCRP